MIRINVNHESAEIMVEDLARDNGETIGVLIPIEAISSWSELLGFTDAIDTLEAILRTRVSGSHLGHVDPVTGENLWTEPYTVVSAIEEAREVEAFRVIEGVETEARFREARSRRDAPEQLAALRRLRECGWEDKRPMQERCNDAARAELMRLSGGECDPSQTILAKCQQMARDRMGIPDPECAPSEDRGEVMTCDTTPHVEATRGKRKVLSDEDRRKCAEVLRPHLGEIEKARRRYCHSLTRFPVDPLELAEQLEADEPEVKPQDAGQLTAEDIAARYTERQDHAA